MADYKTGDGEIVYSPENEQLLFYVMCLLNSMSLPNLKKIILAITQPSERRERSLDTWVTTPTRVKRFETRHTKAVALSKKRNPPAKMGDHCRYCPAQALCPDYNAITIDVLPKIELLSQAQASQLSDALEIADRLEPWIKAVRKMAHETLERGEKIKGFKLVPKRATRVWTDPLAVENRLHAVKELKTADCYKSELKSPPQIEKLCKANGVSFEKLIGDLVSAVSSGTTLAHDSDPRPAVKISSTRQKVLERFL